MRHYLAKLDDGHDYFYFEFDSSHRAGSKANEEDLRTAYRQKRGKRIYKVISVELYQ